jgi:hypothetical protein
MVGLKALLLRYREPSPNLCAGQMVEQGRNPNAFRHQVQTWEHWYLFKSILV